MPLVSQAGRNLFRRQEAQDFVTLVRALADPRDTLAAGREAALAMLESHRPGRLAVPKLPLSWAPGSFLRRAGDDQFR